MYEWASRFASPNVNVFDSVEGRVGGRSTLPSAMA
jgi:hypothetical protein